MGTNLGAQNAGEHADTLRCVFGGSRPVLAALIAFGLLGEGSAALAQPAPAPEGCTVDCQQPDGLIRRRRDAALVGDGIYNLDSLGQTRVAIVPREGRGRFFTRVENDGTDTDDLVVAGSRNATHFWIQYFVGAEEVSARVRAGVLRFRDLAPGDFRVLRVEVTAKASAPVGSKAIARVTVSSGAEPALRDRVKAAVYRGRGNETPIEGSTFTDVATAERWADNEGATPRFIDNAALYFELAASRGIRPEIAYAQSALETGFGHFGGVINASFRNSCGLKTTAGGDNDDPNAHQRFSTWRQGITACIDHLALYAGAPGYPRAMTPDPRHFDSIYATAPTVERLGGRWAPAADYGTRIVNDLLNPLLGS